MPPDPTTRPLWRILLAEEVDTAVDHLTCDECFAILSLLAEWGQQTHMWQQVVRIARRHLDNCLDCHAFYAHRLAEWETLATKYPK